MNQANIEASRTQLLTMLQQQLPGLDFRKGTANYELLVNAASLCMGLIKDEVDAVKMNSSLANTASMSTTALDAIMANWFITRKLGIATSVIVQIVVNTSKDYSLAAGTEFRVGTLAYRLPAAITVNKANLLTIGSNYFFTATLAATASGTAYNVKAGTAFTATIFNLNLVSITAMYDATTGTNNETNDEFLTRSKAMIGSRDLISRRSIKSLLYQDFPELTAIAAFGYADPEMRRDVNNVGIKVGGKADIYCRSGTLVTKSYEVTTDNTGIAMIPSDLVVLRVDYYTTVANPQTKLEPAAYIVASADTKLTPTQARFSIYERLSFATAFINTKINIVVDGIDLGAIQAYVDEDDRRNLGVSSLAKTFIPIFLAATVSYNGTSSETALTETAVNYVTAHDYGDFYVSPFVEAFHHVPGLKYIDLPQLLTAIVYLPNGNFLTLQDFNIISPPTQLDLSVSSRTCRFYLKPSDLALEQHYA